MNQIVQLTDIPEDLTATLKVMPKVEIHIHLEGATSPKTIWEMAQRHKIQLPVKTLKEWRSFYEFQDFEHFIEVYKIATNCMRTPEDFMDMVEDFLSRQSKQNIQYSEAYFSPQLHLNRGLTQSDLLNALEKGAEVGYQKYGSKVRFICDIGREITENLDKVLPFALAGRERNNLFIGLGVGGIEVGYPPKQFASIFAEAREQGLHVVAHAGETAGPESIWGALRSLKAERIGHGIRALESTDLIDYLRSRQTPLEVCPNSNYRLNLIDSDQPHPIRKLFDTGVNVTINSDDPPMFSTDLNNEYTTLAYQGFTWEELWKLNLNTLKASFLPETEKVTLRTEWNSFKENVAI